MDAVGEILLSLSYLPTAERLTVVVAKAKNLVWTNGRTTAGRTAIHASVLWLSSQVCSCLRFWQLVKTHVYLSGSMTVCLCLCLVLCLAVPLFCIYSCLFVCLLNFCFFQLLLLSLPQPLPLFFTFISLSLAVACTVVCVPLNVMEVMLFVLPAVLIFLLKRQCPPLALKHTQQKQMCKTTRSLHDETN